MFSRFEPRTFSIGLYIVPYQVPSESPASRFCRLLWVLRDILFPDQYWFSRFVSFVFYSNTTWPYETVKFGVTGVSITFFKRCPNGRILNRLMKPATHVEVQTAHSVGFPPDKDLSNLSWSKFEIQYSLNVSNLMDQSNLNVDIPFVFFFFFFLKSSKRTYCDLRFFQKSQSTLDFCRRKSIDT